MAKSTQRAGSRVFHVEACWDAEAEVWVATSPDVPGLATEARELDTLSCKLEIMIPELLEANQALPDEGTELLYELTTSRRQPILRAS